MHEAIIFTGVLIGAVGVAVGVAVFVVHLLARRAMRKYWAARANMLHVQAKSLPEHYPDAVHEQEHRDNVLRLEKK